MPSRDRNAYNKKVIPFKESLTIEFLHQLFDGTGRVVLTCFVLFEL